jgi:hypothetical protein
MTKHTDRCICHACMGATRPIISATVTRRMALHRALAHLDSVIMCSQSESTVNALLNTQEIIHKELAQLDNGCQATINAREGFDNRTSQITQ